MKENIKFEITDCQAEVIARHFGWEREDLADFEVAELLDRLIDDTEAKDDEYYGRIAQ